MLEAPVIKSQITDNGVIEGGRLSTGGFRPVVKSACRFAPGQCALPAGKYGRRRRLAPIPFVKALSLVSRASLAVIARDADLLQEERHQRDACLVLNAVILIACLSYFDAVLTLPGIAGIILTIGMAVDSNVLIFERIREEVRAGKAPCPRGGRRFQ